MGQLTKKVREEQKRKHPDFKTTVKYFDKSGKARYKGSRQLKSTQKLGT